jgi:hypothetical protein
VIATVDTSAAIAAKDATGTIPDKLLAAADEVIE